MFQKVWSAPTTGNVAQAIVSGSERVLTPDSTLSFVITVIDTDLFPTDINKAGLSPVSVFFFKSYHAFLLKRHFKPSIDSVWNNDRARHRSL